MNKNYKQIKKIGTLYANHNPFNQKLLWGGQGGGFLEKSPVKHLAAGGKE